MASLIEHFLLSNGFSQASAKKTSLKDSLEWKNQFDKAMSDFFTKDHSNGTKSFDNNYAYSNKPTEKQFQQAQLADNTNKTVSAGREHQNSVNVNKQSASSQAGPEMQKTSSVHNTLFNFSSVERVDSQLKTNVAMGAANKSSLNRYVLPVLNYAPARIHLSKSDAGIRIYARENNLEKEAVMKMLKQIATKIHHAGIAVQEIRLNGTVVNI